MKKYTVLLAAVTALSGAWFTEIFPDPYHSANQPFINLLTWIWRELYELVYGKERAEVKRSID